MESIKNSNLDFIKYENSSQLFKFRYLYGDKNKI